jgi:hypothetical protein
VIVELLESLPVRIISLDAIWDFQEFIKHLLWYLLVNLRLEEHIVAIFKERL